MAAGDASESPWLDTGGASDYRVPSITGCWRLPDASDSAIAVGNGHLGVVLSSFTATVIDAGNYGRGLGASPGAKIAPVNGTPLCGFC